MSNFGSKIPKNYFLLLLLVVAIPLIKTTNPNQVAQKKVAEVCHLEIYTQSKDLNEEPVRFVNENAKLLSDKPDCSIFRVGVSKKPSLRSLLKSPEVIKIVRMVKKNGQDRKSMELLAHEVDMFELAKKYKSENVIKIYDSMVFPETIYIRMEMGVFDLQRKLELMKIKWNEDGHKYADMMADIYEMIDEMATVLADFNRYAIHLALKAENWIYVRNGFWSLKLKLIDLQTAATTVEGKVMNLEKQRVYFCKERKDEAFVPSHASPEHIQFCKNRPKGHSQDQQPDPSQYNVPQLHLPQLHLPQHNLPQHNFPQPNAQQHDEQPQQQDAEKFYPELTAKADIWSMGVVICELLAQTPIFIKEDIGYEILKAVFVPMPSIESGTPDGTPAANIELKEEEILKQLKKKLAAERVQNENKTKELLSEKEARLAEQILKDHSVKLPEEVLDDEEEEVLNDKELKVLEQMLTEKKLKDDEDKKKKEEEEAKKNQKIKMAEVKLLVHFPLVNKLLKIIFQANAKDRPAPLAIKEYIKMARSTKGNTSQVDEFLKKKLYQSRVFQLGYVQKDEIEKVERNEISLLKWKISDVNPLTFCKFCFFDRPKYAKSAENGGSVKKGAVEGEKLGNEIPNSPRYNSDISAHAFTRNTSVKSADHAGSVKNSADKDGSLDKKMLAMVISPRKNSGGGVNGFISPRYGATVFPFDDSAATVA